MNKNYNIPDKEIYCFTVRFSRDIEEKIVFLQKHMGLNKTAIIRLAICTLYNNQTKGYLNPISKYDVSKD